MEVYKLLSNKLRLVVLSLLAAIPLLLIQSVSAAEESPFTEEELAYIAGCEALKVGYVNDRRPVSFTGANGTLEGISRPIFDRIAEISDLEFEYVEIPGGSITYDYLREQGFDFVTSVEYNEENLSARGILISQPYLTGRKVIVADEDFQFDTATHFRVAISTGSQTIKKVLADHYPNFELVDYASTEECFDAVSSGEADLLIQNQHIAEYWLYKPSYENLKVIPIFELDDRLCFSAVTPLERDGDAVWHEKELQISIINKSIDLMTEAEIAGYTITAVTEHKYRYTFGDILYQYRYTILLVSAALAAILLLLALNMRTQLRAIHDRAEAKAKGAFLSAMSHEIRTPLNGLIGLNYLMAQHLDDRERTQSYLKQSSTVAQYLKSLVNNILDMSKLKDSDMPLDKKPLSLPQLLSTAETMVRGSMEDKGISFTMDAELPHPAICGDEMRILQIFVNILDNARKYTPEGGTVTVKVRQAQTAGGIQTTAEFFDTGIGISVSFQKQIFEPFTQERSTVSRGDQGTGLGMAICSTLAKSMGGSLTVQSKLGLGSTFTFVFTAEEAELPEETPTPEAVGTNGTKPHILIAEDNDLNADILTELLTEAGYETTRAMNGKEAVTLFRKSEPGEFGIILMDILMPELDGCQAAEAIRALDREDAKSVVIIACTANSFTTDRDRALASGMNDFLAKPIDMEKLLHLLEQYAELL